MTSPSKIFLNFCLCRYLNQSRYFIINIQPETKTKRTDNGNKNQRSFVNYYNRFEILIRLL